MGGMIAQLANRTGMGGGGSAGIHQADADVNSKTVASGGGSQDFAVTEHCAYRVSGYGCAVAEGVILRIPSGAASGIYLSLNHTIYEFVAPAGATQVRITNNGANNALATVAQLT